MNQSFDYNFPQDKIIAFSLAKRKTRKTLSKLLPDRWDYRIKSFIYSRANVSNHNTYSKNVFWEIHFRGEISKSNSRSMQMDLVWYPCRVNFTVEEDFSIKVNGYFSKETSYEIGSLLNDIPEIKSCVEEICKNMDHRNF